MNRIKFDINESRIIHENGLVEIKNDSIIDLMLCGYNPQSFKVENTESIQSYNKMIREYSTDSEFENDRFYTFSEEELSNNDNGMNEWNVPEEVLNFDIEGYLYSKCDTEEEVYRTNFELSKFKQYDMISFLKVLKYIHDFMIENNITYGVGRGSSVASFCLYQIGIHRINPLEYDIDFSEFLS